MRALLFGKKEIFNLSLYSVLAYLSNSVSLDESRKPLANGLLSILSLVICNKGVSFRLLRTMELWRGNERGLKSLT